MWGGTDLTANVRCWLRMLSAALFAAMLATSAAATPLRLNKPLCFAIAADTAGPPDQGFHCAGDPVGYQNRTLWLQADLSKIGGRSPVLLIHQGRFDRLVVLFRYADGSVDRQEVLRGDFGSHWRIGGQIAFEVIPRGVPVTQVTLGFTHLASHKLLRIRMLSRTAANRDLATAATLAGGSITLLLIGGIYNLSLAIAVRRQSLAWHGLWAVCMVLWGLVWSQILLIALPQVAGTSAAQTCTLLACLAVATATISVVTALGQTWPRWISRGAIALGVAVALMGIPASVVTSAVLDMLGSVLGVLTLADLALVTLGIALSWRGGSQEARDIARSWAPPMAVLALTQLFDFNDALFGGGPQIAVLFASALQTVWLSITTTLRVSTMRVELDQARAAKNALAELANRDPLTGLLNRRGFVGCIEQTFAGGNEASFALLLMDVDLFKSINDQFGHETGDAVLCRIAGYFRRLERELCVGARMGGEEFVIAVSGLTSFALAQFAERVRAEVAALDHGEVSKHRTVTVSIGVAEGSTRTPFQKLYGAADRALYDAKRSGRNKVVFQSGADLQTRELERGQLTFRWPHAG